jgi:hypothetical protein
LIYLLLKVHEKYILKKQLTIGAFPRDMRHSMLFDSVLTVILFFRFSISSSKDNLLELFLLDAFSSIGVNGTKGIFPIGNDANLKPIITLNIPKCFSTVNLNYIFHEPLITDKSTL